MPKVEIDFIKDWQGEILKEIKKEGIKIPKDIKVKTLIIRYLTYLRKEQESPIMSINLKSLIVLISLKLG